MRNTFLEDLHAGVVPGFKTGDYSDVKVISPHGEIPWTKLSRISDEEMKRLMIEVVDRVFTLLSYPEELAVLSPRALDWNRRRLNPALMRAVRRRRNGMKDDETRTG